MTSEMEYGKNISASVDNNDDLEEVMVRRMKNRERQRRYRARKRLEADRKKTDDIQQFPYPEPVKAITSMPLPKVINQAVSGRNTENAMVPFSPALVEIPVNGTPVNFVTRVHSQRDWKRDARRAHLIKEKDGRDSSPIIQLAAPAGGIAQSISFGTKNQPSYNGCLAGSPALGNNQEHTVSRSRRNWKEEARNKKS
ncbi:OLC1v1031292C1 [Oldenlandia corymbosa var. corymbosa]|uniref:OLC1v1031292C1 n=1 Tax=Oldenlandia corymbosa var. corymbosa TaxID=529605 RepID=A0AAV1CI20_OLDCO|nr:OLC1v1031292C1 [Oldenlandia corymbosa var. corymbosa]